MNATDHKYFREALNRAIPSSRSKRKLHSFNTYLISKLLGAGDIVS